MRTVINRGGSRWLALAAWLLMLPLCLTALAAHPHQTDDSTPALAVPEASSLAKALVVRVLDARTVLLEDADGKRWRCKLLGVSVPRSTSQTTAPQAIDARRFLTRLIQGEHVYLQPDPQDPPPDAQPVRAGYLYRAPDMLMANLELIRQGYARYTSYAMSIHTRVFAHYEHRAQDLRRGVWDPDAHRPHDELWETEPDADQQDAPQPQPDAAPSTSPPSQTTQPANPDTVYVTQYGKTYHKEGCSYLTSTARPVTREEVKDTHRACKRCDPDRPPDPP